MQRSPEEVFMTAYAVTAIAAGLALVGVAIYEETSPVEGTVVTTTYEPDYEYVQLIGKVPVTMYEERWTVQVDMDGDGLSDKDVRITEEEFNTLAPGDHYER